MHMGYMIRAGYLLPLLVLALVSCGEKGTDPEPENPGQSRVLFVHALPSLDSLEFQGVPLTGARLVTFSPNPIGFSGISRYLRISALPTELRSVDIKSDEVYLRDTLAPAVDSAYSLFGFLDRSGNAASVLLRDDLARDSAKRQLVRGINLIPEIDSLRFTFIRSDSATIELPSYHFGTADPEFFPLVDSLSANFTLVADILDPAAPGGVENLFTGDVSLRPGWIFTFAAIGTRSSPQIIILSHLDL